MDRSKKDCKEWDYKEVLTDEAELPILSARVREMPGLEVEVALREVVHEQLRGVREVKVEEESLECGRTRSFSAAEYSTAAELSGRVRNGPTAPPP